MIIRERITKRDEREGERMEGKVDSQELRVARANDNRELSMGGATAALAINGRHGDRRLTRSK